VQKREKKKRKPIMVFGGRKGEKVEATGRKGEGKEKKKEESLFCTFHTPWRGTQNGGKVFRCHGAEGEKKGKKRGGILVKSSPDKGGAQRKTKKPLALGGGGRKKKKKERGGERERFVDDVFSDHFAPFGRKNGTRPNRYLRTNQGGNKKKKKRRRGAGNALGPLIFSSSREGTGKKDEKQKKRGIIQGGRGKKEEKRGGDDLACPHLLSYDWKVGGHEKKKKKRGRGEGIRTRALRFCVILVTGGRGGKEGRQG